MTNDPDPSTNDTDTIVKVTILDRAGYTLADSPSHEASVSVTDGDDGLSIISVTATNPSVAEGSDVQFTFTSKPPLANDLDVMVTLTETGNFLTSAAKTKAENPITLMAGATHIENFDVLDANGTFDRDSTVTLTLVPDEIKFIQGTPMASVVVQDDVTTNQNGISVIALESSVTEDDTDNTNADFQIKANAVDTSSRVVNISISQGAANFLSSDYISN